MKAIKTIIMSMLLLAGLTTSCTNDIDETTSQSEAYLKIDAVVDGMTRGAIDATNFTKGDAIGVFVRDLEGKDYDATVKCSNIRARYNGSTWTLESNVPLENGKEAMVYAYYPYNADAVIIGDSIDIDITKQDDVLYGNATGVTTNNPTAKINFKHALARITLAITKGANDVGDGKLTNIRVGNVQKDPIQLFLGETYVIATEGRMDIKTGTFEASRTRQDEIILNNNLSLSNTETKVDVLLVPFYTNTTRTIIVAQASPYVNMYLTIDGREYKQIIRNPQWYAGHQYVYPININRENSKISTPAEKIDMGTRNAKGETIYWASYNIGASIPENVGDYFCWGDPTGKHNEQWIDTKLDSYVQYNDCINYYGGKTPPSNISNTEYDIAKVLWGNGWRMPTLEDFRSLMNNSTYTINIVNGVKVYVFNSKITHNSLIFPKNDVYLGNTKTDLPGDCFWTSEWEKEGWANIFSFWSYIPQPGFVITEVCYRLPIRPVYEQQEKTE